MRHEKIIKREDGTKIKIKVDFFTGTYNNDTPVYNISIEYCPPRKRTWYGTVDSDYLHRTQSIEQRKETRELINLNYATKEEMNQAKLELWALLKPQCY